MTAQEVISLFHRLSEGFDSSSLSAEEIEGLEIQANSQGMPPELTVAIIEMLYFDSAVDATEERLRSYLEAVCRLPRPERASLDRGLFLESYIESLGESPVAVAKGLASLAKEEIVEVLSTIPEILEENLDGLEDYRINIEIQLARWYRASIMWHSLFLLNADILQPEQVSYKLTSFRSLSAAIDNWPIRCVGDGNHLVEIGALTRLESSLLEEFGVRLERLSQAVGPLAGIWYTDERVRVLRDLLQEVVSGRDLIRSVYELPDRG